VPQRRWPQAAAEFQRLLTNGERMAAVAAHRLGVVDALADGAEAVLQAAVRRARELAQQGRPRITEQPVALPAFAPAEPVANGRPLSAAVVRLIERAVAEAASASSLNDALEVGYRTFGEVACTAAAREGIAAFLERRRADFSHTG